MGWRSWRESLSLFREMGDNPLAADVLFDLARLLLHEGDPRRAAALFLEGLELGRRLGARGRCAAALQGLAEAALHLDRPERAGRLFGAAEALREAGSALMPPSAREDHDRVLAAVRVRLGAATFAAARAAGQAVTLEQAVAEALAAVAPGAGTEDEPHPWPDEG